MMDKKPKILLNEYKLEQDPNDYGLSDEPFNINRFKEEFKIIIVSHKDMEIEFDLIGCYPSIANAFRRIMLSEVPSMAIEKVYVYNNTSILQDEVLAHRLGLIPLKADPRLFDYKVDESNDEGTEMDTLDFELKVKCTRRKDAGKETSANFDVLYNNYKVYSDSIKWIPKGKQASIHKVSDILPIHDDILINKLRPGHEMDLKLIAVKGIGKDHAKFSPVATAHYRLLPDIVLNRTISGTDAELLKQCFSPGVIEIDGNGKAYVKDARYDMCSRNHYRYPYLKDAVNYSAIRNHFIFNVESVGALPPNVIFIEAVKCLKKKCRLILDEIQGV